MISKLDEFVPKLKFETLMPYKPYNGTAYHYTSLGNINSILLNDDSLCLWASRHDCLNDISEGTLPATRFEQACKFLFESGAITKDFNDLIKNVSPNRTDLIIPTIKGKAQPVRGEFDTYVESFSENSDALAMWNYYSKGNRYEGMNIGVSSQALLDSLEKNLNTDHTIKLNMVKVVYDTNEQLKILQTAILDIFQNYRPEYNNSVRYCIGTLLASLKPLFKLDYFSHEKEIRLFVNVFKKFKKISPFAIETTQALLSPISSSILPGHQSHRLLLGRTWEATSKRIANEPLSTKCWKVEDIRLSSNARKYRFDTSRQFESL